MFCSFYVKTLDSKVQIFCVEKLEEYPRLASNSSDNTISDFL